ncbi:MAG: redoxin domain-containing protein [Puniceicoccales bacterium]|jgi:peroxiredoxin|nr:redoxin domain-containing protein [Puniceicoccales bacterium]
MALSIGAMAPPVSLKSKTAAGLADIELTRNRGKGRTLLLFVPLAFTSVCTTELCSISESIQAYNALKADVIGISVDSPFAQEAWAEKAGIAFTLASDFNREAAAAYDVLDNHFLPGALNYKGVAKRAAFVIGIDGRVEYAWSSDDPSQMPPIGQIRAALGA